MNALQVLAACKEQSLSLSSYALLRESAQSGTPEKEILSRFDQMLAVMKASAEKALEAPGPLRQRPDRRRRLSLRAAPQVRYFPFKRNRRQKPWPSPSPARR